MSQQVLHNALVVLADSGKAIFLRNIGTETSLSLREEQRLTLEDFPNDGPSGVRPDEQSPRQTDEATFVKQLTKMLSKMRESGGFQSLVLAADPQTLGQLRDEMHKNLEHSIAFTLTKDLTNTPVSDVAKVLLDNSRAENPFQ